MKNKDFASRTFIIDLGMTPEQRGRLLSRLMDLATFRHLALRGFSNVDPAAETLTQIGIQLSAQSFNDQSNNADHLRELSKRLDHINLFFTYGVAAKRASVRGYADGISQILSELREGRIHGYQTLNEYMQRFFATIAQLDRLADRYNTLRLRINEAANLIQARTLENQQAAQQQILEDQRGILSDNKEVSEKSHRTLEGLNASSRKSAEQAKFSAWTSFFAALIAFISLLIAIFRQINIPSNCIDIILRIIIFIVNFLIPIGNILN